jgi:hypothetical protein
MKGTSHLPSFDSTASITYLLAPPSLTRLHFPNSVRCWFEDLDKGNVLHIKPYYLYELIVAFHASLGILINIYSNQNHAYRWQIVTVPWMCTV